MNVISNKSLKDGAYYYVKRRQYYDFFDELYCDSIVPIILEGDFMDLKNVYDIVKDTPAGDILGPWYEEQKYDFKEEVFEHLDSLTAESKNYYKRDMPTYLTFVVDSILEDCSHEIVEQYCGGILNYKKLTLLINRDENFSKLEKCSKKIISNYNFEKNIVSYCNSYVYSVTGLQDAYLKEITSNPIKLTKAKYPRINISDDITSLKEKFGVLVDKECSELFFDIFKDGIIPLALTIATSGTITAIYDVGTLIYDVADVIEDINSRELPFNEKLELYLAQCFQNRIEDYYPLLEASVCNAIDEHNRYIKHEIEKSL